MTFRASISNLANSDLTWFRLNRSVRFVTKVPVILRALTQFRIVLVDTPISLASSAVFKNAGFGFRTGSEGGRLTSEVA